MSNINATNRLTQGNNQIGDWVCSRCSTHITAATNCCPTCKTIKRAIPLNDYTCGKCEATVGAGHLCACTPVLPAAPFTKPTACWKVGDLVLASADAKRVEMLMVVIPKDMVPDMPEALRNDPEIIAVRYLVPQRRWGYNKDYYGEFAYYYDPRQWLPTLAVKNIFDIAPGVPVERPEEEDEDDGASWVIRPAGERV